MRLYKKLYPKAYYKSVFDISFESLKRSAIKGLAFDIDNTLSPFDIPEPDAETVEFFRRAKQEGFSLCLISNNSKKRVELYNKKLNIPFVCKAKKPLTRGLKQAMSQMGTVRDNTVLIGDQIFTDILCGNMAGVKTILVEPKTDRDEWFIRIKRSFEKTVIDSYKKAGVKNEL